MLWVQLFLMEPLWGAVAVLVPIGAYYILSTHWHEMKKPFIIHMAANVVIGICNYTMTSVFEVSAVEILGLREILF